MRRAVRGSSSWSRPRWRAAAAARSATRGCGTTSSSRPLARCAAFIKQHGAVAGIQLGHSGRKARLTRPWEGGKPLKGTEPEIFDWDGWELVAPSAVPHTDASPTPRALSHNEIRDLAVKWGEAAARAVTAGFDVVEIHGAHGYLIHQFLSPASNKRTDAYGGSELNRMRFAVEVAECVRAAWPAEKPLFMRLSCEDDAGWDLERERAPGAPAEGEGRRRHRLLVRRHARALADGRRPRASKYGYQVPYAEKIRKEAGVMTMAVGHIVHADQAEAILQEGRADLIALAREIMYNPNWADGRGAEARRRPRFQIGAAALRLLAGQARQVGVRRHAVDLDARPGRGP